MSAWNSRTLETFDLNVQLSLALLSETNPEVDWKNDEQFRPFCSMPRYPDKSKTRQSCLDLLGVFFFPSRTFTRSCFEPYLWATLFSRWCDAVQCVTDYFPITALSQKYFIPLTNTEFQLLVPLDAILSSIWTKSEFPHRVWWLKCFHNFWVQARVQI